MWWKSNARNLIGFVLLTLLGACSESPAPTAKQPQGVAVDPETVGTIAVSVIYRGTVPTPKALVMGSAPQCALAHEAPVYDQALVAPDGRLKNAVVYIQKGVEAYAFTAPTTAVENDQKGCLYEPRVAVAMVGQPVDFLNSDAEAHNVHGFPQIVSSWNFILSRKGAKRTLTFDQAEMGIRIGCDIHPWMRGYLGITAHPFAGVTDADGSVVLDGVPPGEHTVAAWHETLGAKTTQVTLAPKGSAEVEIVYE
jgi:plastocyanin